MVVDKAVGRLRPLHDHVRTLFALEHDKMAIQCQAFFFKHSHNHLDARPTQLFDASPLHFGEGVDASYHHTSHSLADDKVGTWWRFAVVRTRFEANIERRLGQKGLVFRSNCGKSIYLRMFCTAMHMVAFTDNAVAINNHCPHHGVGFRPQQSASGQL